MTDEDKNKMQPNVTFKNLNAEYLNQVAEIESTCFKEECWTKQMLLSSLKASNARFFGVFCDLVLVGFSIVIIAGEDCDLANICILPQYRGQGIGEALYTHTQNYLKTVGVQKVFLEVNAANDAALALYKKNGFVKINRRNDYYSGTLYGSRDALILLKQL